MLLFLVCLVLLLCCMYCLNCCRLSSTACCNNSPPLAAPLKQQSLEIDLSSSTQHRSLAKLPRRCCSRTVRQRERKTMKIGMELEIKLKSSMYIFYFTTKGRRHSCCLLIVNKLSIGILVGPSRLQARDRKLSRASQITLDVSDQCGSNFSIIRTLDGCRRNDRDQWGKLQKFEDPPVLFLFSIDIWRAKNGH